MSDGTQPHAYPKGGMGLCPFCGKSKINKIHTKQKCSFMVAKDKLAFQCSFIVKGTCNNCIRPFCARHIDRHHCE